MNKLFYSGKWFFKPPPILVLEQNSSFFSVPKPHQILYHAQSKAGVGSAPEFCWCSAFSFVSMTTILTRNFKEDPGFFVLGVFYFELHGQIFVKYVPQGAVQSLCEKVHHFREQLLPNCSTKRCLLKYKPVVSYFAANIFVISALYIKDNLYISISISTNASPKITWKFEKKGFWIRSFIRCRISNGLLFFV